MYCIQNADLRHLMLVTCWTNIMNVQTEKNCGLYLHMDENEEDLTYVCMIC